MARNIFLTILGLVAGICLGLVFSTYYPAPASAPTPAVSTPTAQPAAPVGSEDLPLPTQAPTLNRTDNAPLLAAGTQVLEALRAEDYQTLSALVHPTRGVLFTPYSTVDLQANLTFTAAQVAAFGQDTQKYVWGLADGSGEPLEMTVDEYFARYVYNADYAQATVLGIDRVIGSGNALENVSEAFPDDRFVEYYFPGIDPQYNGFDWCGLKLVFSVYEETYRLVAVIHSEWTV